MQIHYKIVCREADIPKNFHLKFTLPSARKDHHKCLEFLKYVLDNCLLLGGKEPLKIAFKKKKFSQQSHMSRVGFQNSSTRSSRDSGNSPQKK